MTAFTGHRASNGRITPNDGRKRMRKRAVAAFILVISKFASKD
jgi:hypothetical protein